VIRAPMLTVPATIALLRFKYPAALLCTVCAVLLATLPASYAKSNLTDVQRLAYVCAECRQDAAQKAQVAEIRRVTAIANLGAAREARRAVQAALREAESAPIISATSDTLERRVGTGRAFQYGRPRTTAAVKRVKARARDRAHRARQKGTQRSQVAS
jgi:hypothetical protein